MLIAGLVLIVAAIVAVRVLDLNPEATNIGTAAVIALAIEAGVIGAALIGYATVQALT